MATSKINPNSGFCSETKTFHSLKQTIVDLPPPSQPLSITQYILNNLLNTNTNLTKTPFLINDLTGHQITYSRFLHNIKSLSFALKSHYSLSKGDGAFILCNDSVHIPALYLSLLSLGVIIAPAQPHDSISLLTYQIQISKPTVFFVASKTSHKLPPNIHSPIILIDSPKFSTFLNSETDSESDSEEVVNQSDIAMIAFSSGTTGRVKGVLQTHRSLIFGTAFFPGIIEHQHTERLSLISRTFDSPYMFQYIRKAVSIRMSLVMTHNFDSETIIGAMDKYKITQFAGYPSFVFQMLKLKSETSSYDLSSLRFLISIGSPLATHISSKLKQLLPNVNILNHYGLSEGGGVAAMITCDDMDVTGSVGRLLPQIEAKIVDTSTGEALSPGQTGELCVRCPSVMQGYVGDEKATVEVLNSHGWLKTGDLCLFDSNGYLFVVDRLKEIFKCYMWPVAPAELENILVSHPHITDAAVVPYPDEATGHVAYAFVVKNSEVMLTQSQIMDFVVQQVPTHKKIHGITFIDAIPRNPNKKILRRELMSHLPPIVEMKK